MEETQTVGEYFAETLKIQVERLSLNNEQRWLVGHLQGHIWRFQADDAAVFGKKDIRKFKHNTNPTVYFLCGEIGEIIYVGYTSNMFYRLTHHAKHRKFSFIFVLSWQDNSPEGKKNAHSVESEMIEHYQPFENIQGVHSDSTSAFVYLEWQKFIYRSLGMKSKLMAGI